MDEINFQNTRIAFIGTYLPRQCGNATFTNDLCDAISKEDINSNCIVLPVNDIENGYDYPEIVRFEFFEKDISTYLDAANFLNINSVDVVSLQFEYEIFGGNAGSFILSLLRQLKMPVVTTLHSILKTPDREQQRVMEDICALSDRVIVMSNDGMQLLQAVYGVAQQKIDLIPKGILDIPFDSQRENKDLFGVERNNILMSFGLLSPSKGIETVILALPKILEYHPETIFVVVGATHPKDVTQKGEEYRLSIKWLAKQKKVENNLVLYDRFISNKELIEFIQAADIYITPFQNEVKIESENLALALGAGKAVISTPYLYAKELLSEDRGILFPFNDSNALAEKVIFLLNNPVECFNMRQRAYNFGRNMIWPNVAKKYLKVFQRARIERKDYIQPNYGVTLVEKNIFELPKLKLNHFNLMTDSTGIIQHAIYNVPNYSHGYTTNDNARALIVCILLDALGINKGAQSATIYLSFLGYAFNSQTHRFRNFLDYQRKWLDDDGSDDSQGRALMSLGFVLNSNLKNHNKFSGWLFEQSLAKILSLESPRAWAFALLGINKYLENYSGDRRAVSLRNELANRLMKLYTKNRCKNWFWFEKKLTYCNAILSHALIICGKSMSDNRMTDAGFESLMWLVELQRSDEGHFVPIGSCGYYTQGQKKSRFDQLPVEAQTTVSACLEAHNISGDKVWHIEAGRAFDWFLGKNDLNLSLYDSSNGGCYDGLHSDSLNYNQGAESTLAFLQSFLEISLTKSSILPFDKTGNKNAN